MNKSLATALIASAFALAGCNKDTLTSPDGSSNISLSIASVSSLRGTEAQAVTIESAKVLLKNIAFHRFPSDSSGDIKVGPYAVSLNLSGSTNTIMATRVPPAQYDRIRFRLHKPEDFEPIPDPEFREGESGQLRYSVIVRGTFNGSAFVYKSRENASQEIRLDVPITVSDDASVNVTLVVDPASWFMQNGQQLDPTNPSHRQAIDNAIRNSFSRGFRDNNRNGQPD
jgi:hypothetical protein